MNRAVRTGASETDGEAVVLDGVVDAAVPREDEPVGELSIPGHATEEEADAIAAAVHTHLAAGDRLGPSDDEREAQRWIAATRLRSVGTRAGPMLADARTDPWAAAGRACSRR